MNRIVTITLVKDEDRIVESFVRYNAQLVDRMLIVDNGSKDSTVSILKQLVNEGYNIELYSEANTDYKQLYLENKYIRKALSEGDEEWVIPLDVDEFLDMDKNDLKKLRQDEGYYVIWNNYVLTDNFDDGEVCVPKKLVTRLVPKKDCKIIKKITKVILPRKYILANDTHVSSGHHGIIDGGINKLHYIENIRIAHFPIISEEQLLIKIYGKYISYIPNELRGENGVHVNRYVEGIKNKTLQLDSLVKGEYTIGEGELQNYDLIYSPLRPEYVNNIKMKYTSSGKIDICNYFREIAEEFALKYAYTKRHGKMKNKERIIVFGTGEIAQHLFEQVEDEEIEVIAYVNSNPHMQYMRFNKELIITPDRIRFFDYDKILIASIDRYDEIKNILLSNGIQENIIVGIDYLHNRLLTN